MDDDLVGIITEAYIFEGDITADGQCAVFIVNGYRVFRIGRFFRFFKKFEDTLCRSCRALQNVHHLRGLCNRLVEGTDILDECLNVTDCQSVMNGQVTAEHTASDVADVSDQVCDRLHQSAHELCFPAGFIQLFIQIIEFTDRTLFAAESFHDDVTAVHFLDMAVHIAERLLLGFEVRLAVLYHEGSRNTGEGNDNQCHDRQLPGNPQHHVQHADDRDH